MSYLKDLLHQQTTRPLIESAGKKASYIQLIGFALIFSGVLYLFAKVAIPGRLFIVPLDGTKAALIFFIIMLGCSLAFPDLLCDKRKELSTMRIVVFMMVNVICLLLIKTGWESKNLTDVGLNGYWVSIVAFVFGGKAAQSYFEQKMSIPQKPEQALTMDYDELLQMAIDQHIDAIRKIKGYTDMHIGLSSNPNTPESTCIIINTSLNNRNDFPSKLSVKLASGETYQVNTEVVTGSGVAKINAGSGDGVCNQNTTMMNGTICCAVVTTRNPDAISYLTCSHVLSGGDLLDKGGEISTTRDTVLSPTYNFAPIGNWSYGMLNNNFDMALVDSSGYQVPSNSGFQQPVSFLPAHIGKKVFIKGNLTQCEAYIIGKSNEPVPFQYNNSIHTLNNLIKISRYAYNHIGLTVGGDSGAMVYFTDTNVALGMVIGSNEQYTFVSPLADILTTLEASIY